MYIRVFVPLIVVFWVFMMVTKFSDSGIKDEFAYPCWCCLDPIGYVFYKRVFKSIAGCHNVPDTPTTETVTTGSDVTNRLWASKKNIPNTDHEKFGVTASEETAVTYATPITVVSTPSQVVTAKDFYVVA